ncbi:hypothetical protein PALU110988_10355 [Paenibacillus lupini]|uniref:hypothetical protein n=1 Tax=Paenibacillus lupini TaxID=1450204 RepID=UPI00142041C0|nr:hypothetical protein [Paenibacillus lupini]NIK22454.1 hypothetical protein [Paenibacillus lupini]
MMDLLKLVKYDWKRNSSYLLVVGCLFIIAQAALTVTGQINHWSNELFYVFSFVLYLGVSVVVCVTICRTYERNLRYFNRRLLPLPALYTVLSPLLLGLASLIVIVVLGVIHLLTLGVTLDTGALLVSDILAEKGFWAMLVSGAQLIVMIFLSITVAKVFAGKAGVWIGVAAFFVIQVICQWLEDLMFPQMSVSTDDFFQSVSEQVSNTPAEVKVETLVPNFWGPLVFEIVIMIVLIYVMTYLINRKVQMNG